MPVTDARTDEPTLRNHQAPPNGTPSKSAIIEFNVEMTTRDGVTLRADVYRPNAGGPVPAVVLRTPYDKAQRRVRVGGFDPVFAVENGYAFVLQDVRGRWASEGEYVPISKIEGPDGYDCIEWVAAQPWCDGNVGMIGVSYESLAQYMAAEQQPPHLRAIVPEYSGDARLSFMRLDSIMVGWAASQAADWMQKKILTGEASPQDLSIVMDALRDPQAVCEHLPLEDMPLMKVGALFSYGEMIEILRSASGIDWERIQVPALMVAGWYDIEPASIGRFFTNMKTRAGTEAARDETAIVWGIWEHGIPFPNVGEGYFGLLAGVEMKMMSKVYLSFFDRHLRGDKTSMVPVADYFLMGANEWRTADAWPPPDVEWRTYYLDSTTRANSVAGDGRLTASAPTRGTGADRYVYDPHHPVPSRGGRHFKIGGSLAGPFDQYRIESRQDVLVYTSEPLESDLQVVGDCRLRLFITTDVVDTDFAAKVCDVDEAGVSFNITDGITRMKWRSGTAEPDLLEPGKMYEVLVDMGNIAHVFRAGHRIRVQIASSAFPGFDRNMNTGHREGSDATGVVAHQEIWHQGEFLSRLELQAMP